MPGQGQFEAQSARNFSELKVPFWLWHDNYNDVMLCYNVDIVIGADMFHNDGIRLYDYIEQCIGIIFPRMITALMLEMSELRLGKSCNAHSSVEFMMPPSVPLTFVLR